MPMDSDRIFLVLGSLWVLYFGPVPEGAVAQNGDRHGEVQRDLPEEWQVPARDPLSPEEAIEEFVLAPGYRIELVASEPMIHDPVQIAFDADGSIWVVEMRGYMPDADGTNEHAPVGRVVHLRDTDGDGQMDESSVFMDKLVLPRAIAPSHDGLLIVEPPNLYYCRDTDGDGTADDVRALVSGFKGLENPEHAGNGLRYGIDNWFETSQHQHAFKFDGKDISVRPVAPHGQWGVTRDDLGRVYYSPNSDPLIGDAYPKHYIARNREGDALPGVPRRVAKDMRTWPVHITPGVNRGYQERTLRADGTLARFTAACGPEIFRGELLGEDAYGDAFVCEAVGNLVKQYDVIDSDGVVDAKPAYEGREFLASTDERFRPVSALTGPDGALYITDFYRGVVQHRIYMTTWLRKQIDTRGLAEPVGLGRIWRVVRDDATAGSIPDLSVMSDIELAKIIANDANGNLRDTAQRLLVERGSLESASFLRDLAQDTNADSYRRIQALWILHGINALPEDLIRHASYDPDRVLRETAARLCETMPASEAGCILTRLAQDAHLRVRMQSILSAGELPDSEAFPILADALEKYGADESVRIAVYSGLSSREPRFIKHHGDPASSEWLSVNEARQRQVVKELVDVSLKRMVTDECSTLMGVASERSTRAPWQSMIIFDGVSKRTKVGSPRVKRMRVHGAPAGWSQLSGHKDLRITSRRESVDSALVWSGRPGMDTAPIDQTPAAMIARGKRLFGHCMSCHQPNGRGLPPIYPPLDESPYVTGSPEILAKILLNGLEGPITVAGREYNQAMPPAPVRSDADIAAIMTYVRQAWGNDASPVSPEFVRTVRTNTASHPQPWTAAELMPTEISSVEP